MKTLCHALFLFALLQTAQAVADIAVVVTPESPITQLDSAVVARVFMKKTPTIDGVILTPVDLPKDHPLRESFYKKVLNRTPDYMLSYWTRLVFTGRGSPPAMANSEEDLLRRLTQQPGLIGYMDAAKVDARAKIVLRIKE